MENLIAVNRLLSVPNGAITSYSNVVDNARCFISSFEKSVPDEDTDDDLRPILSTLRNVTVSVEMELALASVLKILFRKKSNRDAIGKFGFASLVQCLTRQSLSGVAAAELGNTVLNACFDSDNVLLFLAEGGLAPLLRLLRSSDTVIQGSVLGALQGICFTVGGKYSIRSNMDAISTIAMFLISDCIIVRARAVGTYVMV